ncbi:MAG: transglutaminase-like domain-containing protein [Acidobacteriota bacterium]
MTLETIACPEECALAEAQPAEFFTQAFASSPERLSERMLDDGLVYVVRATGETAIHFPTGSEQTAEDLGDGTFRVRVDPGTTDRPAVLPEASPYLGQTRWLQSQAPEVMALLSQAGGVTNDSVETMHRLEAFVRDYVSDKNLSVGYATALETARSRSGDCTEHALLLAALGRSAGIPTRVATGLAYVENWLGASNVFVPHAWTQALIDGRWVSFDAALYGFDAGHLALSFGDGDPWNFYDGVNTLGNFEIVSIEVLPE